MNEQNARKLLFDVADALEEVGLPFCFGFGTLLGAIRENRFIPFDGDIDLSARAEEFEPLAGDIERALMKRGLRVELIDHRHSGYWNGRPYAVKYYGHGEHGDIAASAKLGPYRYHPSHASRNPYCIVFDDKAFSMWRSIKFYGRQFNVPVAAPRMLYELYDQWEVPDKFLNQSFKTSEHRAYIPHFLTKQDITYVPMCLDVVHPGHLNILKAAAALGKPVWVGLLSDEAIRKYKPEPVLGFQTRLAIALALKLVDSVACQQDYLESLLAHKPAFVVHGDDWREGAQAASRQLVIDTLQHWGGELVEVPYTPGYSSTELKAAIRDAT